MRKLKWRRIRWSVTAFLITFSIFAALGAGLGWAKPTNAAPLIEPQLQLGEYAGPESCAVCHGQIHSLWQDTRHAKAFSSPIFQQNWEEIGSRFTCLECHTTGWDPNINKYAFEGVTCESCHGPFQSDHPEQPMPVQADAELCGTCHETTKNEWEASQHAQAGIVCESCHNPHAQAPKADTVTALCTNCHSDPGSSFTHGTHAEAGLECSNCHMFTSPRTSPPIEGLVPTGHTFSVGSDACIGCHQDTVHTRDTILELTGEVTELTELDTEALRQRVHQQEERIEELEANSSVRLYTGLAQGAIVGLATGSVTAWVVSRSMKVVEVEEGEGDSDEQEEDQD